MLRSSPTFQRPDLLERAWALPVAKRYAPLLSQGITSLCGPTSVANVLRSIGVQDARKNPFRKFGFRPMSLDQIATESAELVPAPWRVRVVRTPTVEAFRTQLQASNDEGVRFVLNFSRAPLFNGGGGHHSPIGGYLADEDLVFVLDVNSGYGPWLVSPELLFQAANTIAHRATGATRGLARFER